MPNRLWLLTLNLLWTPTLAFAAAPHGVEETGEGPALLSPQLNTSIWVLVIFVILLIILYPTAWKNVLAGLKAREQRIRSDITQAEAARARAEATLKEYNDQLATAHQQVRDLIAKAQADAEKIATNVRMHAQQESEEIKERAQRDIDAAKNQALGQIYEQTADLATRVAEKILRRNLNAEDQQQLVDQSLEQLETLKPA